MNYAWVWLASPLQGRHEGLPTVLKAGTGSGTLPIGRTDVPKVAMELYHVAGARILVEAVNILGDDGEAAPGGLEQLFQSGYGVVGTVWAAGGHHAAPPMVELPDQGWVRHECLACGCTWASSKGDDRKIYRCGFKA